MKGRDQFAGKVALVTGAGRGVGRVVALSLAHEGATIAVCDIDSAGALAVTQEILEAGGRAQAYVADVSDDAQVKAMVDGIARDWGTVHILVNNAGVLRSTHPVETISCSEWDWMMAVNVRGAFLCTKYVLPLMKGQREGKIVNVSSIAGRSSANLGGAHYTASKAAVLGLTRHTAREVAAYNISVNAVAPGSLATEMTSFVTPEQLARIETNIPLGRRGRAEEAAAAVVFLVSEQASFITGATLDVNGGNLMI